MSKKDKAISITFINKQNKVFDFSKIILRDDNGKSLYSDRFVHYILDKYFGGVEILKKLSLDSNKPMDSWNNTNKMINELKHQIYEKESEIEFLKARLNAIKDTQSYITHVNSCNNNIEWLA